MAFCEKSSWKLLLFALSSPSECPDSIGRDSKIKTEYINGKYISRRRSMEIGRKLKLGVILFAILYLAIGLADLIGGSTTDSRFYIFDNLLIRFIGLILIISSIGIFFREQIARKGFIVALSLSIIEIFIGVPKDTPTIEFIMEIIIMLLVYVPGLVYFIVSKTKGHLID